MEDPHYLVPTESPHLIASGFSHKGFVRDNNEDTLSIRSYRTQNHPQKEVLLAILADGVGGHSAGEIASKIGVKEIAAEVETCANLDQPDQLLANAILRANQQIVAQAKANEGWRGMGSTCVCALIVDKTLYIANLGDSRLYFIHKRKIQQLTFDHTWLEELSGLSIKGMGTVTRNHPLAHVLNRYLGSEGPIDVDLRMRSADSQDEAQLQARQGMQLSSGDSVILVSDGISDLLSDQEIMLAIKRFNPEKNAKRLVYNALKKGGHDNATAICIQV
jgi:protein phosphatase